MKSIEDILDKVRDLTVLGKLRWNPQSTEYFEAELPKYTIFVSHGRNDDAISYFTVGLRNKSDTLIDSIVADEYSPKRDKVGGLFEVARRSAYNVDDVISDIEDELTSLGMG